MKSILFLRTSLFLLIALLAINLGASAQSIIAVPAKPPVSSPVKAKITPKKKVSQKRTVAPSTKKISKRTANSDVTTHKISDTQSDTNQSFFPIYGITLGLTTKNDIVKMGYKPKLYKNGPKWHVDVNSITFWDHEGDGVIESVNLNYNDAMPQKWLDMGMKLNMSYNKWIAFLKNHGFVIINATNPSQIEYEGRQTLSANIEAINTKQLLSFSLDFSYGNDNGEGATVDSNNSLYSINIKKIDEDKAKNVQAIPYSTIYDAAQSSSQNSSQQYTTESNFSTDLFFPIFGITIGETTKNDIVKMGYKPELYENGPKWHVDVNNVKFWDFKGDGVIKDMYLLEYGTMPQKWVDLGMDLTMSYNKWMTFLRKYRFEVTESNIPQVVEYSGRQTLSADVTASNKQLQIQIHLDFDYGNDHGDGYTKDSKNTLYQVSFKSLK